MLFIDEICQLKQQRLCKRISHQTFSLCGFQGRACTYEYQPSITVLLHVCKQRSCSKISCLKIEGKLFLYISTGSSSYIACGKATNKHQCAINFMMFFD